MESGYFYVAGKIFEVLLQNPPQTLFKNTKLLKKTPHSRLVCCITDTRNTQKH